MYIREYCNKNAELSVTAEGPGTIQYQWQKDGKDIVNEKLYKGARSSKLTIDHLRSDHAGQYTCTVKNENGMTVSEAVNLTLRIKITEQPQTVSAHYGEEIKICVEATGQKTLHYQWKKDGKEISDNSGYSGTSTNQLTIKSMSETFQGNYICVVSNEVDEEESCKILLMMARKQCKSCSSIMLVAQTNTEVQILNL